MKKTIVTTKSVLKLESQSEQLRRYKANNGRHLFLYKVGKVYQVQVELNYTYTGIIELDSLEDAEACYNQELARLS